ncbi:unnamed protein product [Schistosoma curassoni]|uniref:GAE domain-containing protein n=1 Tax=Schistosoma curassoni TaxID=6186 RepID=A0A183JH87_9TREM|nr:unnamed protein product [Schistosoma curassoni]
MVGGSQQKTLELGFVPLDTHRQGVSVILRKLMLPDRFDPVSPSFTVIDVNIELSVPRLTSFTSCTLFIEISYLQNNNNNNNNNNSGSSNTDYQVQMV